MPDRENLDYGNLGQLDCLINNAGIFDTEGPQKSKDGSLERTFMVNAFAPFVITYRVLKEMAEQPQRIINTSSTAHTDCFQHLEELDYDNLQFEKGEWTAYDAYGLSKLLIIMFTRGLRYMKVAEEKTTLITMDPGTVNTKLLIAGWGECGIDVEDATETFHLAISDQFEDPGGVPKFY